MHIGKKENISHFDKGGEKLLDSGRVRNRFAKGRTTRIGERVDEQRWCAQLLHVIVVLMSSSARSRRNLAT
jgi:hypothetical protein